MQGLNLSVHLQEGDTSWKYEKILNFKKGIYQTNVGFKNVQISKLNFAELRNEIFINISKVFY